MKKTILLAASLLAAGKAAVAQDITFGVKGGLNRINASTNIAPVEKGKETLTSFHAGVVADFGLSEHFSIQPQLLYNGKGVKFVAAPDHIHTIRFSSIDLPIFAVYKVGKGFYIGAGPNFGINVSGKDVLSGKENKESAYKLNGGLYDYRRFDYGVSGMVGYQHASGLFVSANYLKGLRKDLFNFPGGADWSHNVLAFSAGYLFNAKK